MATKTDGWLGERWKAEQKYGWDSRERWVAKKTDGWLAERWVAEQKDG